jgi:hypothetical protein
LDTLEFKDLSRAAYTANRLLTFIDRLRHYARREPADLDQAKDMLGAIAEVCKNTFIQTADTYDQVMVGGIPRRGVRERLRRRAGVPLACLCRGGHPLLAAAKERRCHLTRR